MILSIIIPTRNRAKELLATLQSICKQTSLTQVEIIIIDNGSTDDTALIVDNFKEKLPIVYEYNDIPGLLTGRHRGAEISKGTILCFLDDDVELNANFIKNLKEKFSENQNIHLATGPCLPNYEVTPPEWLNYFWDSIPQGKYCFWLSLLDLGQNEKEIDPNLVWGLNFSIRKKTFIELGGFHPDSVPENLQYYQGDGETGLTIKAIKNGYKAFYIPGLALKHYVPATRLTVTYFKKRAFFQGVCNSYTNIRQEYTNEERTERHIEKSKQNYWKIFRNKLHPYYRWIKKIYQKEVKNSLPKDIEELFKILGKWEQDGFDFHQNQFKNDEQVKNWVLKENYWDYKLPTK